jgi:hypothetical protein
MRSAQRFEIPSSSWASGRAGGSGKGGSFDADKSSSSTSSVSYASKFEKPNSGGSRGGVA